MESTSSQQPVDTATTENSDCSKGSKNCCSVCKDSQVDPFKCDTCQSKLYTDEEIYVPQLFCICCVMRCIKSGHKVKNLKGQEPAVCTKHFMIETEYCQTCNTAVCFKCATSEHSEHKFAALEKQVVELKTQVFELLSKMEVGEKTIRMTRDEFKQNLEVHKSQQQDLKTFVQAEIDKLKQEVNNIIDKNDNLGVEKLPQLDVIVDKIVDMQKKLRDLLSISNAHLVEEVSKVKKECSLLQNQATDVQSTPMQIRSCQKRTFIDAFSTIRQSLTSQLESNLESSTDLRKSVICSDTCRTMFSVTFDKKSLTTQKIEIDANSEQVFFQAVNTVQFSEKPKRLFPIHSDGDTLEILILTTKREAWLFDPTENFVARTQYPKMDFLWPYRVQNNEQEFHWSYWDESIKKIRFTHSDSFKVALDERPSIKMSCSDFWMLCFICKQKVYLVDNKDNSCEKIPVPLDDASKITCVSTYGIDKLFLWFTEDKSVDIYQREYSGKWTRHRRINWNLHTNFYSTGLDAPSWLIPFVLDPEDAAIHHVYASLL